MKNRTVSLIEVRKAVADYMSSEGCSCCQDTEAHDTHKKTLAKLLDVRAYKDKSGYDFYKHKSKRSKGQL